TRPCPAQVPIGRAYSSGSGGAVSGTLLAASAVVMRYWVAAALCVVTMIFYGRRQHREFCRPNERAGSRIPQHRNDYASESGNRRRSRKREHLRQSDLVVWIPKLTSHPPRGRRTEATSAAGTPTVRIALSSA